MHAMKRIVYLLVSYVIFSCGDDELPELTEPIGDETRLLPVVVHVLHNGEQVGEGANLSKARIMRQVEILNEDFRRREGTRGYNNHPHGGDTKVEFVLAKQDPDGNPTTGIVRRQLQMNDIPEHIPDFEFEQYAFFSYWSAKDYINIWIAPYPKDLANVVLGMATGPDTDLPGSELFQKPLPGGAEGIIINWSHFGESDLPGGHNLGRTLTHEMGHYLGLLHTWGSRDCLTNDYCDDTPAVDDVVVGDTPFTGCDGEEVMIANYMNYSYDHAMNIFTMDQIDRMDYVLKNSPNRNSLVSSPGLASIN